MKFCCAWLAAAAVLFGQTAAAPPEFEVASIKPSEPVTARTRYSFGLHIDGAQVRFAGMPLKDVIRMAYGLKEYQVTGPEWLATARFDLNAKLPGPAPRDQVLAMMQSLLAERFQLQAHRTKRELSVYGLVVEKSGLKMKESAAPADEPAAGVNVSVDSGQAGTTVNLGNGSQFTLGEHSLIAKRVTMAMLADQLARFVDRPVVDMTGLKGNYDLTLDFEPEDFRAMKIRAAISAGIELPPQALRLLENASDGPLLSAVQGLGLRLESRKAPVDVLVVDGALKVPKEN
jgi:uncharacterized protein (TIGR03435 family)